MGLQSIDLQFVLHKNEEAAFKQNQFTQKPVNDQVLLGDQEQKNTERKRQQSSAVDKTNSLGIKSDAKQKNRTEKSRKKSKMANVDSSVSDRVEHPYKGHHIDLSL